MGQITTTREIDIDLTTVIAEGQIEVKDLLNWIKEYYEGTVTDLIFWDLTRANVSPISDSGFAELFDALRDRDEIRAWGKTALVFGDESGYKTGKDFMKWSESKDIEFEIRAFRDLNKARLWLGLEEKVSVFRKTKR